MLREVAENAVFEAESEIERHRVLYHKEREKRKKLSDKLSFYKQLEQRLKNNAADSTSGRIQWLFDEQQRGAGDGSSSDNRGATSSFASSSSGRRPGSQSPDRRPRSLSYELRHMSVSALRKLLDERKVPHRDCLEKGELLFRAKQALSAEAAEMTEAERVAAVEEELNQAHQGGGGGGGGRREGKLMERKEEWEEDKSEVDADEKEIQQHDEEAKMNANLESFAADAMSPNRDEEQDDAEGEEEQEEDDDDDGLVFRLSRRSGKRGTTAAASPPVAYTPDEEDQISAAEQRKKKQEKLRAKRRAAVGKQRSGRRTNRRENRRQKQSPESATTTVAAAAVPPSPTPSPPPPPPAPTTTDFVLPTPSADGPTVTSRTTMNTVFDLPDLQRSARRPPPPSAPPAYTPSRGTNQRIEERRLREELVTQQRAEQKGRQLRQAEQVHKAQARQTERVQGTIKDQVQRWAVKKSLIRMLCTLEKIMPRERVPLPKLDLRLSSTAADVKRAYKQALRAVHPDKLATASVDDRVRGEFVFSALRESYARSEKLKEDKERGRATNAASPRGGGGVGGKRRGSAGAGMDSPAWSRRW